MIRKKIITKTPGTKNTVRTTVIKRGFYKKEEEKKTKSATDL